MADKSTVCTICNERHIYRQPTDWCFECEQAFCSECKEFHAILKSTKSHATIPITAYQTVAPSISFVSGYCSDHDEKYGMFCQTHDNLLCQQCIEGHSECKDVIPLAKITRNVKTSEAFREAEQCLVDISENILNIEDKIKDKIILLNNEKEIILSEINNIRQKINEHLDQIEAVIKKEVMDIEHNARKELETAVTVLKEKKERNSSSKQQLENVKEHASDLQTFYALRQISAEISAAEIFLQSIIDNGHIDTITLELGVDENLRSIPDKIKTFGCVRVKQSSCDLKLVKKKDKQAQLVGVQSGSIHDIKLKLTQTITTNISSTTGCDILPDGKLVFCDYSDRDRLVIADTDGKHLFEIPVQCSSFDVTCVSDNTVAVTTGGGKPVGITIIDISSRTVLKFIYTDYYCYGITSVNGSLVYCVGGKGIEMTDVNGENTTTIVRCDLPYDSYIASYNDKLYYTDRYTNTVTCCDMKGNTIWTFNNTCCDMKGNTIWTVKDETVLRTPYGISVDNDGHVYVVSYECSIVVVLSADGQQSRQILTKEDGLNWPTAIHYDRNRKLLLVTNNKTTSFLFGLS